jgi:AcrR family transcriptional regulator
MLREKAKASKRRAILSAAERQFARKPYHEVTLEEIAAEAEVAKGTLYLYFASKTDLYLALIVESFGPMIERLEEQADAIAEKSAWSAIAMVVKELLHFKREHAALHEVLRETSRASQEAIFSDLKESLVALIARTLRRGIAHGEIADPTPEATAELILAAIPCASSWMAQKRNKWTADECAAHLLLTFGNGLLVKRK